MLTVCEFFIVAEDYICREGYQDEIKWAENIKPLEEQTAGNFFLEYVWVVLNARMREQVARKIYERYIEDFNPRVVKHPKKQAAIIEGMEHYETWFANLKAADDKLAYLDTLPFIGTVLAQHLARNMGVNTVKHDVHMVRVADAYGYSSPSELALDIQSVFQKTRLGVIDLIIWRFCNLVGSEKYLRVIHGSFGETDWIYHSSPEER